MGSTTRAHSLSLDFLPRVEKVSVGIGRVRLDTGTGCKARRPGLDIFEFCEGNGLTKSDRDPL